MVVRFFSVFNFYGNVAFQGGIQAGELDLTFFLCSYLKDNPGVKNFLSSVGARSFTSGKRNH